MTVAAPAVRAVVAAILVAVGAAALPIGAAAPAVAADRLPASMRLVDQSPFVPMGFDAQFTVALSGARPDDSVVIDVRAATETRAEFARKLIGGDLGTQLGTRRARVSDLRRLRANEYRVSFPTILPGTTGDRDSLRIPRDGVYPVRMRLQSSGGDTLSEFVTWLVAYDASSPFLTGSPLDVALVVPVEAPPLHLPGGRPDPLVEQAMRPGGRLDSIARDLAANPSVPASVLASPETVASWAALAQRAPALADGFDALVAALRRAPHRPIASPYVPIDVPAAVAAGLGEELPRQLRDGTAVLADQIGADPVDDVQVVRRVDPAAVEAMAGVAPGARLVVDDSSLDRPAGSEPLPGPVRLRSGSRTVTAAANDTFLASLLSGDETTGLKVQRFLAGLAVEAFDRRPDAAVGTVVVPPGVWEIEPGLIARTLDALASGPLFAPRTLTDWFDTVPPANGTDRQPLEVRAREQASPPASVSPERLDLARRQLASLARMVGDANDRRVVAGTGAIATALYGGFENATDRARVERGLDAIAADARAFLNDITTAAKTVTITGHRARVPITLRNGTGRRVDVTVSIDSSKLVFPHGREREVSLPKGTSTVQFSVEARTTGAFSLFVTVATADRMFEVDSTRITVHTTIFGGLGAWLTAGAAAFLAAWWLTHFLGRRRRAREDAPA